ncbi:MAG: electron transport complex subunit RsxC [Oscillospiraceae bacterium]|nr:electron transport complex subunit RsxC [Oscillospiraceae bacterium]
MPTNFKGGIYIDVRKSATHKKPIEEMKPPREVIIPILMHKGVPCGPIVDVGEHVKLGQKIAESTAADSAPIHSSVSGTVTAIEPRLHINGEKILSIVIENDFEDETAEAQVSFDRFQSLGADELAILVRDAGIVGLGGSAVPLSQKLLDAAGKVDTLIINGAECEPYITSDNRIMVEYSEELYDGAMIVAKALGIKKSVVAVQSDKAHAIAELRRVLSKKTGVSLCVVHTKYPQGAQRQIITAVTGRELPPEKTPSDIGVITINASTAVAVSRAVREGKPLTTRVVTVSGSAVANPKNLLVRIGTPIGELFDACGGFLEHPDRVVAGGPMMGFSQYSLDTPVIKSTNALLAFCRNEDKSSNETTCIHCGKCVGVCPMNLMPLYIYREYKAGKISECEKLNVTDCTECGCCSYICPARISLVSAFRAVKVRLEEKTGEEEENADR